MPDRVQAFLATCGDKHFAAKDGFSERTIREFLFDRGIDLTDTMFYEDRFAGGPAVILRSEVARAFFAEEIVTYVTGPIEDRKAEEGPVDEVLIIAAVHRSCGGCKSHIGELFGTEEEIPALESILLTDVAKVINEARGQVNVPVRAIGIVLAHNGAPIGEIIELDHQLIG